VHADKTTPRSIVVPGQMQHAVDRVEQQLAAEVDPRRLGGAAGVRNANHDFTGCYASGSVVVERERENIGRPGNGRKPFVQCRHLTVTHERD
jgi:hypothetical protein